MDYSPEPDDPTDNLMECADCGREKIVHYTAQLKCPNCGSTRFGPVTEDN